LENGAKLMAGGISEVIWLGRIDRQLYEIAYHHRYSWQPHNIHRYNNSKKV